MSSRVLTAPLENLQLPPCQTRVELAKVLEVGLSASSNVSQIVTVYADVQDKVSCSQELLLCIVDD